VAVSSVAFAFALNQIPRKWPRGLGALRRNFFRKRKERDLSARPIPCHLDSLPAIGYCLLAIGD